MVLFLTFSPIFVILTISYEGLFYIAFCATLVTWVRLEHRVYQHHRSITTAASSSSSDASPSVDSTMSTPVAKLLEPALVASNERLKSLARRDPSSKSRPYRLLSLSDARIALFFLFLIQSAFFSTGNIASISSFSLDSVYRLIPVFNPFSQGALLLIKILIPFAIVSANLGVLNRRIGVAPSALFMVVMAISDIMTLTFFFSVRDEGSWLDIGTSISHFFIASLLCVFVAALEALSELFVRGLDVDDDEDPRHHHFQENRSDHPVDSGKQQQQQEPNGIKESIVLNGDSK